jgi:hypothetical protein
MTHLVEAVGGKPERVVERRLLHDHLFRLDVGKNDQVKVALTKHVQ